MPKPKKLTFDIKKNPDTGTWFCLCKEFPSQTYMGKTKKSVEYMAKVVQSHFDKHGNFNK